MKILFKSWIAPLSVAAVALSGFQISTQLSLAQPPDTQKQSPPTPEAPVKSWNDMTPQQKITYDYRNRMFREAMKDALENNYRPKFNNGSQRHGLTVTQLPQKYRAQARKIAAQYKNHIYPALLKYVAEHDGRLPNGAVASRLPGVAASFTADPKYKGVGLQMLGRESWSIGINWRLDGTVISRDLFSKNSATAPHDVWAQNSKFENTPGKLVKFRIRGWDDGKVTFDNVQNDYFAIMRRPGMEEGQNVAAPGQAGIPRNAIQGQTKWNNSL